MLPIQHDPVTLSGAASALGLAAVPWFNTLDLIIRIVAGLLSITVSIYVLRRMARNDQG